MSKHINLSSYPGGGKTTIARLIMSMCEPSILISKFTTRPPRPEEKEGEYLFITEEDFQWYENKNQILLKTPSISHGKTHWNAIPSLELWEKPKEDTKFVLSLFGSKATEVKKYAPDMKLFFVGYKNIDILIERLRRRCEFDHSDFEYKKSKIINYLDTNIQNQYDYIVYNDGTPEETAKQIINIVGIPEFVY